MFEKYTVIKAVISTKYYYDNCTRFKPCQFQKSFSELYKKASIQKLS